MSRKHKQRKETTTVSHEPIQLSFGDPVPVMDHHDFMSYLECVENGRWYEPPVSLDGLAKSLRSSVAHSSPIYVKRNILVSTFKPHKLLSTQSFSKFALDYLVFGNAYLNVRKNVLGGTMQIDTPLAKYVRRGIDFNTFFSIQKWNEEYQFKSGSVFHLLEPDINQEIYGVPEYLSSLNSAWLNESATLFRRKYFENGQHAGYIMYITDPAHNQQDIDQIRSAVKNTRGRGNFRNLFMYAPAGKKDGIQIIPLSEVTAKDEFFNIKKITSGDSREAHRVMPQLMGVLPENSGGLGDIEKAAIVFATNELLPLQGRFKEFNHWFGEEVIAFNDYALIGSK